MTAGGMAVMVGVAGCDEAPPTPPTFGSVEQCMLAGNPKADCEAAAEKVAADHTATAPKYADTRSCEQIHGAGNCEPRRSGSGFGDIFMPAVAGFVLGQALSGGGLGSPQPVYRDPRGYSYLPGQAPWIQPQQQPQQDQGRGRSVWGGGSSGGGTSYGGSSYSGGGVAARPSAPPPAASAPASTAQRGVLGATGRSSSTSASAGS